MAMAMTETVVDIMAAVVIMVAMVVAMIMVMGGANCDHGDGCAISTIEEHVQGYVPVCARA